MAAAVLIVQALVEDAFNLQISAIHVEIIMLGQELLVLPSLQTIIVNSTCPIHKNVSIAQTITISPQIIPVWILAQLLTSELALKTILSVKNPVKLILLDLIILRLLELVEPANYHTRLTVSPKTTQSVENHVKAMTPTLYIPQQVKPASRVAKPHIKKSQLEIILFVKNLAKAIQASLIISLKMRLVKLLAVRQPR